MTHFWLLYKSVVRTALGWDHQEWLLAFFVVVVFGCWCLRGFGSRSNY